MLLSVPYYYLNFPVHFPNQMVIFLNGINEKGNIYKKYEELKKKLETEGLFENSNKKAIPKFSSRIGVVTSLNGSVIKDIVNMYERIHKIILINTFVEQLALGHVFLAAGMDSS